MDISATILRPKAGCGPSDCLARVNIATGKVECLEEPMTVNRKPGTPDEPVYGVGVRTTTLNSQGQEVAAEDRLARRRLGNSRVLWQPRRH
jgi:hypothetical protein